jgi:branched-subunit amino acid ABC-type transport system permease component
MEKLFQAIYGGILYGSIYGLMAIGLTLIWGALRMLNLAHGSLYVVGGYVAWTALNEWALPALPSFALGVIAAALVGLLIQVLLINRLLGRPSFFNAAMIATVGAAIVIESAMLLIYGPRVKQMAPVIPGHFKTLGVVIQYQGLVIIVAAAISLVLLSLFLRKSRYGLAIQAVSQQMDAARLMGIPTVLTFTIVMAISAGLAGLAGVLLSSVFYLAPTAGFNPMVKALVVTIFGGLGSVKGTIWAAYVIGLLEAFLQVYFGAGWALPGLFLFMMIMLIIRPTGLFGMGEVQRL